ncbi:sensor histidine kinase [Aggregatilinea lenta]|uniref:sensor histidine kinase n=1 Tax=Aggregatilinea lenta TaxID=913108 RepID=UPI000E5B075B|nr:ATP-binding protein [Aggregatilinea lenta]
MDALSAQLLPDAVPDHDLLVFQQLSVLAANRPAPDALLDVLCKALGAISLSLCFPGEALPDGERLVVAPLNYAERHIADLCADMPPGTDSAQTAARLMFFSPLITLTLAANRSTVPQSGWTAAAQQEHDRLEAVLDATNDAILMIDTVGTLAIVTLQFERYTGIPRYEVLGQPFDVLAQKIAAQPGLPEELAGILRALAENHTESLSSEIEIDEPQHRILVWYSVPVYGQSGMLLGRLFAFRDVMREREVDRLKTEFITLVSHELRTPLTSVKGFSDLILESGDDALPQEVREYLGIIAENADRLVTLINDIIDITRIESDRVVISPQLCALPETIAQVTAALQSAIEEKRHRLTLDIAPDLPQIWADPARMAQILTNLLSNAIKYTLHPGEIVISARYIDTLEALPDTAIRDPILPCVLVSVQDTGVGIPPGDQPYLFKPFYRTNNEIARLVGGTGLGLMIVKSFVEMQGGQVWFESAPGEGSTFYFTAPVVESKSQPGNISL